MTQYVDSMCGMWDSCECSLKDRDGGRGDDPVFRQCVYGLGNCTRVRWRIVMIAVEEWS
jgi:hypothetical protein